MNLSGILSGLSGLTGNPATAALFKLIGIAAHEVTDRSGSRNSTETVDAVQQALNQLVDAFQGQGIVPNIRMDEPRHEAALALALNGTPIPPGTPTHQPAPVPDATV